MMKFGPEGQEFSVSDAEDGGPLLDEIVRQAPQQVAAAVLQPEAARLVALPQRALRRV